MSGPFFFVPRGPIPFRILHTKKPFFTKMYSDFFQINHGDTDFDQLSEQSADKEL